MRDMDFATCMKSIALVKKIVGNDWITRELEKINSYKPPKNKDKLSFIDYIDKFHPLALLIYRADKQLRSCAEKKFFEVSEEIVQLSYLGESLFILQDKGVKGFDNKIKDLVSSDKALFDKTVYEVQVAAVYAKKNVLVEFIPTESDKGIKTPDLLIANEIEIECKKKDRSTSRDIKNIEFWKLIMCKTAGLMEHFASNFAVFIKTQKDPQGEDVDFILQKLRELIEKKRQGRFEFREKGVGITLHMISTKNQEVESNGIQFGASEELDYVVPTMEIQKQANGKVVIRNPRIFGFKSAIIPDRVTSVINSIKDAKGQFSGNKPGLIYVNLNTVDRSMLEGDFKRLDILIRKILINNSKISGVVITSEYFTKNNNGYVYSHRSKVVRNENAKNPIPLDFQIVGENVS